MTTLSPADRLVACFLALAAVLMLAGTHYLFRVPINATRFAATADSHMP